MADEPQTATPPRDTVRLDDLPTYRAISNLAVASLLLGLLSALSIASLWFLVASVGAIALGWMDLRRIQRYPDVYTGTGLARAGIGLGLVCGLGAATSAATQAYLLNSEATRFARNFAKELKEKDFPTVMWYRSSPAARQGKSGAEVTQELRSAAREGGIFESEFGPMKQCIDAIKEHGKDVELLTIEQSGLDGLTPYAYAVLELHDHDGTAPPEYVLLALKAEVKGARYDWWVERFVWPYQRGTMQAPSPKIDDGHGHGQ